MRYIGSKTGTLPWLTKFVAEHAPQARSLCDPFAGTCSVSRMFKSQGFRVVTGDVLELSYVLQIATIGANRAPAFRNVLSLPALRRRAEATGVERVFAYLNGLQGRAGYLSRNFSEGAGRLFFSDLNAGKIDAVRETIQSWDRAGLLSAKEKSFLLAALICSADKVANTAGTYYAHLKSLTRKARKIFVLLPVRPFNNGQENVCRRQDARDVAATCSTDILYLDPPYNDRDYSGYYHLPETLARGDEPLACGASGIPKNRTNPKSDFCSPSRAQDAFATLVRCADARHIMIHSTTDGLVSHDAIVDMLSTRGSVIFNDVPVRAYSSRSGGGPAVAVHRVYWCATKG